MLKVNPKLSSMKTMKFKMDISIENLKLLIKIDHQTDHPIDLQTDPQEDLLQESLTLRMLKVKQL